jgi:release factor glutamine methyltransferase
MTIAGFLATATKRLADIPTARLDALVLLSNTLGKDKSWVLAHTDHVLLPEQAARLNTQLTQRAERIPLAYIIGKQEFYGREFMVTSDVLIPRPDTEALIDLAKKYIEEGGDILDVGTGSGAIAITLALELPHSMVEACDISKKALEVATDNAEELDAHVHFFVSDLLTDIDYRYFAIVANLPYVASHWQRSAETHAEPDVALFADDDGLALIKKLIDQAPGKLHPGGHLLLEADPRQHEEIIQYATQFTLLEKNDFAIALQRR